MKSLRQNASLLFLLAISITACSGGSGLKSHVRSYSIVHPELDWGSYLQIESPQSILTISKKSNPGIVRLSLPSQQIQALDPSAAEAKDLLYDQGHIIYRLGSEIRLLPENSGPVFVASEMQKLRTFLCFANQGCRITADGLNKKSYWFWINERGQIQSQGELAGSARASIHFGQQEGIVFQNDQGLWFGVFEKSGSAKILSSTRIAPIQSSYVTPRIIGNEIYIAFFDDEPGVLKLAHRRVDQMDQPFSIVLVDGDPDKNYRGLDIAIWNDQGHPGLFYMDGWQLKLRVARWKTDHFESEQLPFQGAVGFFTQILEEKPDSVRIAFHNFRTPQPDGTSIFENLAVAEISF